MRRVLTQQLKRFTDDERAVSPVVGFVLIFALIVIVFTLYQAEVVPAQNAEIEFKHSQQVRADMSRLNDAMDQAGTSGVSQSVTIDTGVQYPNRAFAINPGAPAGTLQTSEKAYTVKIKNVKATGENAKYFDHPEAFTFESKEIAYSISYNVYQQDPTIVIAPGLQFVELQDGSVVESTSIITGNTIDLTLLDTTAEYQQSAMTTSVDVVSTSTTTEYMTIGSPGSAKPKIVIETSLSLDPVTATNFENELARREKIIHASYTPGSPSTVTLTLEDATYEFRLTEVGTGFAEDAYAHYLTSDSPTRQIVSFGGSATLTVTARDELGNPVSNAAVTATINNSVTSNGTFARTNATTATATTNDEGQVTFEFRPQTVTAESIKVDVILDNGTGGTKLSTVTYTIEADARDGFIDNGYKIDVLVQSVARKGDQLEIVFKNRRETEVIATTMQLNGFLSKNNTQVNSATLGGTTIPLNEGPVALGDGAFTIPAGGTKTVTLDLDEKPNGVGLLIIDVTFETADGQTLTATSVVSIS